MFSIFNRQNPSKTEKIEYLEFLSFLMPGLRHDKPMFMQYDKVPQSCKDIFKTIKSSDIENVRIKKGI